ncbi:MAG: hypothetical protein JXA46_02715 [Dehalococcoidales bacterium]|nr:hypothetical protein [Dehalococcoidales bacterium]
MDRKVIDWLMEGPIWLRYATELQLKGNKPYVQPVLADSQIEEIIDRLKNPRRGIPAIKSGFMNSDEYGNPYWDLFFLADLGLTASELGLTDEIEGFLDTQSPQGTYITEYGMEPTYHCKSAILLSAIARMGYHDEPHVKKYLQIHLSSQRLDGGWYCNPNHDVGAPFQNEPSCPQENLNILLLLGQYPEYREDPRFNGAIDLLLKHWEMRNMGIQIVYFGVGRRYQALRYPATRYGILRVMDAVSLFPYSLKKASFYNMLEFVRKKAVDGKYFVEAPSSYTSLEPANQPNRLLTFIITRIEKRVEEFRNS